ncbi:hypothetical protein NDN08_000831 [Rhodosorus marinus]|uniref:Uncharacterized protein n=1 Tax=Rhodosorus marinus TaxID=101924 RepID=A0AAV8UP33_9RHOD|nr:hypothetical protein NDN08_000831 [Rhodosorus marinus]
MALEAFSESLGDSLVRYQFLWLESSVWVWVNSGRSVPMGAMAVSAPIQVSAMERDPPSSILIGALDGEFAKRLARKLAKRFGLMVYMTSSLPKNSDVLEGAVEKKILEVFVKRTKPSASTTPS